MHGQAAEAQWFFRDASGIAPSSAWQSMAHLDRSFVAQISRNEAWALDELAEAVRLAKTVAWGQTHGEERLALVSLAVLLAPVDAAQALQYAATCSLLGTDNVNPSLAIAGDRRGIGFEKFAFGRIEQMLGNRDSAQASFEEAYEIFAPVNYHYQAILAASALAEVTGDPVWLTRTHEHVRAKIGRKRVQARRASARGAAGKRSYSRGIGAAATADCACALVGAQSGCALRKL